MSTHHVRGLYAIYDHPTTGLDAGEAVASMVRGGATTVQLRAKALTTSQRIELLRAVAPSCHAASVPLIVNDDVDAALAGIAGVSGVHLGQGDPGFDDVAGVRARARAAGLGELIVGISTHDATQLRGARRQQPDYVAFGPVASTTTKANPDPVVGFDGLLDACRRTALPVVAIGGLDEDGARRAAELGAAAIAVIGALVADVLDTVEARARALHRAIEAGSRPLSLDEVVDRVPVVDRDQLVLLAEVAGDPRMHAEIALPFRFAPIVDPSGAVKYRPCDVLDLLHALDKRPSESWKQWAVRGHGTAGLVQLRRPS